MGIRSTLFNLATWADPEETRASLGDPDPALREALLGPVSASGASVTLDSTLTIPAAYQAIRLISTSLAVLPITLRRYSGGGSLQATDHPVHQLIHRRPNKWQTPVGFWTTLLSNVAARNVAYAQVVRDQRGEAVEVIPLDPSRIRARYQDDGAVVHVLRRQDGTERVFRAKEIFKLEGFSWDGLNPVSPIQAHRRALGMAIDSSQTMASFFGNQGRPGMRLTIPDGSSLTPEAKDELEKDLAKWEGSSRAFRTMILQNGVKLEPMGLTPEDQQTLETGKLSVLDVARIWSVPAHMLASLDNATFSNIEHQQQEFVTFTLAPWAAVLEQAISRDLLTARDEDTHYAKVGLQALLRGDSSARAAFYSTLTQNGIMTSNEARAYEDMNPSEQDGADALRVQSALVPLDKLGEAPNGGPVPPANNGDKSGEGRALEIHNHIHPSEGAPHTEERDHTEAHSRRLALHVAHEDILRESAQSVTDAEVTDLLPILLREQAATNARIEVSAHYQDRAKVVREGLEDALTVYALDIAEAAAHEAGEVFIRSASFDRWLEKVVEARAVQWTASSLNQILELLEEADSQGKARDRLDEWQEKRADKYAKRQTTQTGGAVAIAVWSALGRSAVWATRGGNCAACNSIAGRVLSPSGGAFAKAGDVISNGEGKAPIGVAHDLRHPSLHRGCDCYVKVIPQ